MTPVRIGCKHWIGLIGTPLQCRVLDDVLFVLRVLVRCVRSTRFVRFILEEAPMSLFRVFRVSSSERIFQKQNRGFKSKLSPTTITL